MIVQGDFLENLKKLRKEKKLTQFDLQIKTGIDQASLSKFETGERIPTIKNLCILADFFNTSLDYLTGRTDMKEPYPKNK